MNNNVSHLFLLLYHSVQTDTDGVVTHKIELKRKNIMIMMRFCYLIFKLIGEGCLRIPPRRNHQKFLNGDNQLLNSFRIH